MLAITAKTRILKSELLSAKAVTLDIIGSLKGITEKSDVRKSIGIFAVQMPDWKILTAEKEQLRDTVRKVCTGEITEIQAIDRFTLFLHEIEKLDAWIQVPLK